MTYWREHHGIVWADDFPSGGIKRRRLNGWWFVLIALAGIVTGFMAVVLWPEMTVRVLMGWMP